MGMYENKTIQKDKLKQNKNDPSWKAVFLRL